MDPAPPATCPRCRKVALDDQPLVRHCARCKGSWIAEETLHHRVAEARGAVADAGHRMTWRKEARAALMCAICAAPMETLVVQDTAVDRCPQHGVWFDAKELAHVLAAVAAVAPLAVAQAQAHAQAQAQAAGSDAGSIAGEVVEGGAELAIDVAAEAADAASAAGEAVETGGGVFEVVIDGVGFVAEAVVEVLGGIFSSLDF